MQPSASSRDELRSSAMLPFLLPHDFTLILVLHDARPEMLCDEDKQSRLVWWWISAVHRPGCPRTFVATDSIRDN